MSATVPVFVPVRDRLEGLVDVLSWLQRAGMREIWLIDNASTYPPLLAFLDRCPHRVVRLAMNLGHRSPWISGTVQRNAHEIPYVVTDPDIVPDEGCPFDAVDHFADLLERHPEIDKVGFGLRIDDLPEHYPLRDDVVTWESRFWRNEVEAGVFAANIDTTFALYRPLERRHRDDRALRTGPPYVARHLPWYSDPAHLSSDEEYYRAHADLTVSNWNRPTTPLWKRRWLPRFDEPTGPA